MQLLQAVYRAKVNPKLCLPKKNKKNNRFYQQYNWPKLFKILKSKLALKNVKKDIK